ncbi:hypothetical protein ACSBR1_007361 [Camellia fascicularis]
MPSYRAAAAVLTQQLQLQLRLNEAFSDQVAQFLYEEEIEEIAHGLELSKVNFRWVVRFPMGEKVELDEALPKGFIERVGERRSSGALGSTGKNSGPFKHWWLCESLCM